MTVFITGDRSLDALNPGFVAVEMLRALAKGEDIMTGDNGGVEAVVRTLAEQAEFPVIVVASPKNEAGYTDWDARHQGLSDEVRVLFVHSEPMSSRIGHSLVASLPEERVQMLSPAFEVSMAVANAMAQAEQGDDSPF
jgi:hypothetical protein